MAKPLIAGMPPDCALDYGCTVEFVAIDPVSGNAVSGVTVNNASIYVTSGGGSLVSSSGPFMLVPGPGA